ncbi:peptide chain release factor 2 [Ruminococcus sp. CAG:579]|uniref:peptide chain release factor 2 n=1 Tax=Ruminococcus sp. 210702-SL.1.03 TaxID=2883233 RepID=UPI00033F5C8A|nr:peptide chain release factor 2 [Ruminococcus sp. 210702-SL.1.03]MCB6616214.1 peptide chain release factor 2 [Ruminococcus sp. 210702-SL.1.03]CDA73948.1 peptide chain release factor 2 [Ruminococcus sp. CAG:579]
MVFLENLKSQLESFRPKIKELHDVFDIENSKERILELQEKAAEPGFWDDPEKSQPVLKETRTLEGHIEKYEKITSAFDDIEVMIEMAAEEEDSEEIVAEIEQEIEALGKNIEELTLASLLTGEYDKSNAILNFHAGAGGTEAQDWTEMLFRMYTRWGELHGFNVKTLDYLEGGDAGLKSASIIVEGENAYGYLKSESGVHRLVRVSPFDASGSRHTSFSAIDVMPEMDDSINVEINPADIEMQVYRSSGAGGQHINKTSSAVRLIHKPTGIVTSCQTQRSQFQNRDYAMKMLVAKLVEIKEREHLEKIDDIKGVQKEIAWGAQIRSYVFMPYTLVKDHRTGYETANVNAVMDGNIDGFINAYLKSLSLGNLNEEDRKD